MPVADPNGFAASALPSGELNENAVIVVFCAAKPENKLVGKVVAGFVIPS